MLGPTAAEATDGPLAPEDASAIEKRFPAEGGAAAGAREVIINPDCALPASPSSPAAPGAVRGDPPAAETWFSLEGRRTDGFPEEDEEFRRDISGSSSSSTIMSVARMKGLLVMTVLPPPPSVPSVGGLKILYDGEELDGEPMSDGRSSGGLDDPLHSESGNIRKKNLIKLILYAIAQRNSKFIPLDLPRYLQGLGRVIRPNPVP